jgi:hypothetical protein
MYAGLSLLDRQLVDRNGRACGKVDDVELEHSEDTGALYVSAILTGPGALMYRLRRRRLGDWMRRVNQLMTPKTDDVGGSGAGGGAGAGAGAGESDPGRIAMSKVSNIGNHLDLAVEAHELGTASLDRWAREHIVCHIPGARHQADS